MTDQCQIDAEEIIAISDPGESVYKTGGYFDRVMINVGNTISWIFPILMLAIVAQVFLRGGGANQAWLDDAQWWMYGIAMLTAFGYAISTSSHVRVDIFYQHFSAEKQAKINAFAFGWLLLPFIAIMTDVLMHYAWQSIQSGEGSSSPNGLHRLYLLKSTMPVLFLIAGAAAWSRLKQNLEVFSTADLARLICWTFPAVIFILWRAVHYTLYWFIFFTNSEIKPRRISREPIFEYSMWIALCVIALLLVLGLVSRRRRA